MRLFIAIELPESLKQEIGTVREQLRKSGADANWTRPEGIHLTLKFLGEVEESLVPLIKGSLAAACRGIGKFRIEIAGAGAFPNLKAPRVLWLGVQGDVEKLGALQASVEDGMADLGFEREERKFSPHLTLGRVKFPRPRDNWQDRISEIRDVQLGGFEAGHVSLMKSELRRDGAVYTEMARIEI
ncbi:MAG: RNA 2',3'-cyclic phosphodiesterase [Nitrospirota bacterium]|nr:RNA 2',3'-cyclic phosphodiesterase [Nitrospirota bacterium]